MQVMARSSESAAHEGYLEYVFTDGCAGSEWGDDGVAVSIDADGRPIPVERRVSRPPAEVIGWRVACDCPGRKRGWASELWIRVPSRALEDLSAHRIHATDEETWTVDDRDDVHAAVEHQWHTEHAEPFAVLDEIREAQADLARATTRLDDAVCAARRIGTSWEAIGQAAGVSRQSAHQRWGKLAAGPFRTA